MGAGKCELTGSSFFWRVGIGAKEEPAREIGERVMQQERFFNRFAGSRPVELQTTSASRKTVIGLILVVALVAFEIFNFDTTRYALNSILG